MKTLFLFTVLFILVAIGFKEPDQSPLDFYKVLWPMKGKPVQAVSCPPPVKSPRPCGGTLPVGGGERLADNPKKPPEWARIMKDGPGQKPKPSLKPSLKPGPDAKKPGKAARARPPAPQKNTGKGNVASRQRGSSKPGPDIEAKPVKRVVRQRMSPPRRVARRPAVQKPGNTENLAELGRNYRRAARHLAELK